MKTYHSVETLKRIEIDNKLDDIDCYKNYCNNVNKVKNDLLTYLIEQKKEGKKVIAYGAPAKGNTLLNYCGVRTDYLDFTVDKNPYKQGNLLPGTHIPIKNPKEIKDYKPDYILILPWNIKNEIMEQLNYISEWNGKFVVPIPELKVIG